jgi:hypothetical protein
MRGRNAKHRLTAFGISANLLLLFSHGARLSPLGTAPTIWLTVPIPDDDDDDCGIIGEMRIDRGNRITRRKPAPVPLCPPQITYDLTRARTKATAVGSRRLIFF